MKVILINKCKDGDINDIVDVSDGYAKNFLIKNGFGVPMNPANQRQLNKKLETIQKQKSEEQDFSLQLKQKLEEIELEFNLGVTKDVVHGSITNKQILKQLKEKGFNTINKYNLEHNSINFIGMTKIKILLQKDIVAQVRVKVGKNVSRT